MSEVLKKAATSTAAASTGTGTGTGTGIRTAGDPLFSQLRVVDVQQDLLRNIVSLRTSQDLFDDLSPSAQDWALAQQIEDEVKPPPYQSAQPVISRPFEDAQWFNAIGWPFKHWQASRFSTGAYGVWYGSKTLETTVHETAHHWLNGLLKDAGFDQDGVVIERKVYRVACHAALLDFRPHCAHTPALMDPQDYSATQAWGARLHREGHPGLMTHSVRHEGGENAAVLNPAVLSAPRPWCVLSYCLAADGIHIEKQPGVTWMRLPRPQN